MKKNTPTTGQTIFGIIVYYCTFKRVRTKAVRQQIAANTEKRWQEQLKIQKALDAEHSQGRGTRYIDGVVQYYEPYTAESLRTGKKLASHLI